MTLFPADLRADFRWLAGGFLLMLCSGFGQTYFVAIFAGRLKDGLAIGDGTFGTLYTVATLASAAALLWLGKLADRLPIRWLGAGVLAGLALSSVGMASVEAAWMLGFVLFGLRLFGQGLSTHVAMTAMARWFSAKRGRAVSIAIMGLPVGEGAFPPIAVALMALIGWRHTWLAGAALLALVAIPLFVALIVRERVPAASQSAAQGVTPADAAAPGDRPAPRDWTRAEVLRHPLFYALMPGLLAPPFILTGVFFNQVAIVEAQGWALSWFAANFPVMAGVNLVAALTAGALIDRFGARRLLAVFLLPLGVALLLLAYVGDPWVLPPVMVLIGLVMGSAATLSGALWAELYGTRHLGAIRAPATAAMVVSTALAPGLSGLLLDAGIGIQTQLLAMAVYSLAAAVWMAALARRLTHAA